MVKQHHYSSLQCHIILQKSLQYADLFFSWQSVIQCFNVVTISICNSNGILEETTTVILSKQHVNSTRALFPKCICKHPKIACFDPDSIEFPDGFCKTLQIAINNSSILRGHKKSEFSTKYHSVNKIQRVTLGTQTKTTRFPWNLRPNMVKNETPPLSPED